MVYDIESCEIMLDFVDIFVYTIWFTIFDNITGSRTELLIFVHSHRRL